MKSTLLELVTSKKFLAAVTAIAVYIAGRFGLDLDVATLDRIYAALLVYVGAQGAADVGKSAARIRAVAATAGMTPESSDALKRIASTASVLAVMGVVLFGAVLLTLAPACGPRNPVGPAAKTAAIDCAKADQGAIQGFLIQLGLALYREVGTDQEVNWTPIEDRAVARGATIGGCALARFVAELHRDQPAARTLAAAPDPAAAALERVRARLGGVTWNLGDAP